MMVVDHASKQVAVQELRSWLSKDTVISALATISQKTAQVFEISSAWTPDPSNAPEVTKCFAINPELGACVKTSVASMGKKSEMFSLITPKDLDEAIAAKVNCKDVEDSTLRVGCDWLFRPLSSP